jgi:hypothetical protein
MQYYIDVVSPLVQSGDITDFELQKPYILQEKFIHEGKPIQAVKYVADFYVKYKDGHEEVIDIKGFADATALLKRKLFWYKYPEIDYYWLAYSKVDGGWIRYEDLKKARVARKRAKQEQKEK